MSDYRKPPPHEWFMDLMGVLAILVILLSIAIAALEIYENVT